MVKLLSIIGSLAFWVFLGSLFFIYKNRKTKGYKYKKAKDYRNYSIIVFAVSLLLAMVVAEIKPDSNASANSFKMTVLNQSNKKAERLDGKTWTVDPDKDGNAIVKIKMNKNAEFSYHMDTGDSKLLKKVSKKSNKEYWFYISVPNTEDGATYLHLKGKYKSKKVSKEVFIASDNFDADNNSDDSSSNSKSSSSSSESSSSKESSSSTKATASEKSAFETAEEYVADQYLSEKGVYDQLTSSYGDGFSSSDANYAINQLNNEDNIDWNKVALKKAEDYQKSENMSPNEIMDQLTSSYGEQFTQSQAQYAVSHLSK